MESGTRQAYASHMAAKGQSPNTIRRRLLTLDRIDRDLGDPLLLGRNELEDWANALTIKPQSRRKYIEDIAAFYRWAIARDLIDRDPTVAIDRPKCPKYKPRPIGTDDLRRAIRLAPPRTRRVLVLAAYCGLRDMEIAGLHADDIDWERGNLRIRGKGDVERIMPMHPSVADELRDAEGWVAGWAGQRVQARSIGMLVSKFLRRNGIDRTAHTLRHWFGTETYAASKDLRVTQELLGHASPSTTAVYTAHDHDLARSAVHALPAA